MHLGTFGRLGIIGGLAVFLVGSARSETTIVYVFDYDFSVNGRDEPIVDAVINVGDTVRWVFLDSGHSATSVGGNPEFWDSGYIGVVGQTYEHTFTNRGVWWYYCFPHGADNGDGTANGMVGTVTVVPAPGALALGLIVAGFGSGFGVGRRRSGRAGV
jgi:hypothetical protein